ncbi:MAG: hypothetical protein ACREQM_18210 [Candidatus Dormibacteraceae bacterium]
MKVQITVGNDAPARRPGLWGPAIKLGVVGLVALAVLNRRDIRRYLRLRRM